MNFFALWAKKVPRLPRNRRRSLPSPCRFPDSSCRDFDGNLPGTVRPEVCMDLFVPVSLGEQEKAAGGQNPQ